MKGQNEQIEPQTRQAKAEATKKHILATAATIFSRNGYLHTSVEDIAERAGVAKGSVFHHYSTKRRLALKVAGAITEEYLARLRAMLQSGSLTIESLVESTYTEREAGLGVTQILFAIHLEEEAAVSTGQGGDTNCRPFLNPIYKELGKILEKLGCPSPRIKARMFLAILDGIALQFSLESRWEDTSLIRSFQDQIVRFLQI